jgi:hypothetical protein
VVGRSGDQHVRFGSLADLRSRIRDVRFTPKSGHAQRLWGGGVSDANHVLSSGSAKVTRSKVGTRPRQSTLFPQQNLPAATVLLELGEVEFSF